MNFKLSTMMLLLLIPDLLLQARRIAMPAVGAEIARLHLHTHKATKPTPDQSFSITFTCFSYTLAYLSESVCISQTHTHARMHARTHARMHAHHTTPHHRVAWREGRMLVWDATCPDTLVPSHISLAAREGGTVTADANSKKRLPISTNRFFLPMLPSRSWEYSVQRQKHLSVSWHNV